LRVRFCTQTEPNNRTNRLYQQRRRRAHSVRVRPSRVRQGRHSGDHDPSWPIRRVLPYSPIPHRSRQLGSHNPHWPFCTHSAEQKCDARRPHAQTLARPVVPSRSRCGRAGASRDGGRLEQPSRSRRGAGRRQHPGEVLRPKQRRRGPSSPPM
jgi:hypothetical protein